MEKVIEVVQLVPLDQSRTSVQEDLFYRWSSQNCFSSGTFEGCLMWAAQFRSVHSTSVVLRSGMWLDRSKWWTFLFWSHAVVDSLWCCITRIQSGALVTLFCHVYLLLHDSELCSTLRKPPYPLDLSHHKQTTPEFDDSRTETPLFWRPGTAILVSHQTATVVFTLTWSRGIF